MLSYYDGETTFKSPFWFQKLWKAEILTEYSYDLEMLLRKFLLKFTKLLLFVLETPNDSQWFNIFIGVGLVDGSSVYAGIDGLIKSVTITFNL